MRSTKLPSWISGPFASLAGLAPVPVSPHVFAVGPERIDYARFERGDDGFECSEMHSVDLPDSSFQRGHLGGVMRDPGAFQEALSSFIAELTGPIREASLVLPDSWLRLLFTESSALPAKAETRDQVLRFKLKRLVPFRVEELRVIGTEVTPLPLQEEPQRVLVAFALENLLAQLEAAFGGEGVVLGQVTNRSLSVAAAVSASAPPSGFDGLLVTADDGYTLLFSLDGEPVLHRFKPALEDVESSVQPALVRRDLRLTRGFLESSFPGASLARVLALTPPEVESTWLSWLAEGLGCEPVAFDGRHAPTLTVGPSSVSWGVSAPLLGAANREVA